MKRIGQAAAAIAVVGLFAPACGTTVVNTTKEAKRCELSFVTLTVMTSDRLNPTNDGDSRPVELRIYQLKDDVRLQSEDFYRVWKDDKAALREDVLKRDEVSLYPSTRTEIRFERNPEAQFIAGVALFRTPTGRSWLKAFELPPAPGKGDCRTQVCEGGECTTDQLQPKFSLWLEGSRVEDGAGHVGDAVDPTRIRVIHLSSGGEPAPAASAAPKPAASK